MNLSNFLLSVKVVIPNLKILRFIKFNKKRWISKNNLDKGVILLDFFDWYPLIHFWSYTANFLSKRENLKIKYFYFPIYKSRFLGKIRYLVLKKIYESFNCEEGIKQNFKITKEVYNKYYNFLKEKNFKKKELLKFSRNGIKFGDLIYNSYLRSNLVPTINDLNSKKFIKFFIEANLIFDQLENFFSKNKVKYVISSHVTYLQYGLASRFGDYYGAKVIKCHDKGMGTSNFGLKTMHKGLVLQDFPYYQYNLDFEKLELKEKISAIKIGKELIENRVKGIVDYSTPYMKNSAYSNNLNREILNKNDKRKIIIFSHCFFDEPHRYRRMLFDDFFDFIIKTVNYLKDKENLEIYIKPHPNGLPGNEIVFKKIKEEFLNINNLFFIDKQISNNDIVKSNPNLAITVHGTVSHELAYNKITTINAGDNPHVNYDFNLNPTTQDEYFDMIDNTKNYMHKLNFDKEKIYEFLYMHYHHYLYHNTKKDFLPDYYFTNNKFHKDKKLFHSKTNNNDLLDYYIGNDENVKLNIEKYLDNFFSKL